MHTATIKASLPDGFATSPVIAFSYRGPRIHKVRAMCAQDLLDVLTRFDHWLGLVFVSPRRAGDEIHLEVDYEGAAAPPVLEAPVSVSAEIALSRPRPTRALRSEFSSSGHRTNELRLDILNQKNLRIEFAVHNLAIHSIKHLARIGDLESFRACGLFWNWDMQSAPSLLRRFRYPHGTKAAPNLSVVKARLLAQAPVFEHLCKTFLGRANSGEESPAAAPTAQVASALPHLTDPWIDVFNEWRGSFADEGDLMRAVSLFATGSLMVRRDPRWCIGDAYISEGAPNGPAFICFAEFALLCCADQRESDLGRRPTWELLARLFIPAIEAYALGYADRNEAGNPIPTSVKRYEIRHATHGPWPDARERLEADPVVALAQGADLSALEEALTNQVRQCLKPSGSLATTNRQ